jgi:DHA1 family tetracycline resistance protein-like MFS transporter
VLFTEPFWGVPYNLFTTYASVYMLALGCSTTQIGLISSVGLVFAMVFSLAGGSITDRLGRRRTTLTFDLIAWSCATLLWAFSRNFTWFLVAAVVNSFVRITQTSWTCLMIEDTPVPQRVHIYAWVYVVGIIAGMVAPVAGILVERFGLVPAMRGLYLSSFVIMTGMFLVRNAMVTETRAGLAKMKETRHAPLADTFADYARVARRLLHSPLTLVAFSVSTLVSIQGVLRTTFFAILLTRGLSFPDASIAIFPAIGAAMTMVVYLLVLPSLSRWGTAAPLVAGLGLSAAGLLLLAVCPPGSTLVVALSTVLSAAGAAVTVPHSDTLVANTISEADRAKSLSIFYVLLFAVSSPFGYLGGVLFEVSDRIPFLLAAGVLLVGAGLAAFIPSLEARTARNGPPVPMRD